MRLYIVEENSQTLTKLAERLNRQVKDSLYQDLRDLVADPRLTHMLIRKGMTAPAFVLVDRDWIEAFLNQWHLLDANTREQILDEVSSKLLERIQNLKSEGVAPNDLVLAEGTLSNIGGFLSKLAKFASLIIKLLIAVGGGNNNINTRSAEGLRILNPYAVYILTKNLRRSSLQVKRSRRKKVPNP